MTCEPTKKVVSEATRPMITPQYPHVSQSDMVLALGTETTRDSHESRLGLLSWDGTAEIAITHQIDFCSIFRVRWPSEHSG